MFPRDPVNLEEANAQLRNQAEVLATTLRSIGDGVLTTDAEGNVSFLNPVAEELTGWTTEQAAGRPCTEVFDIVNERSRRPVQNPVERVLAEGIVVGLANHTVLIARDGSERPIDDSGAPIRDESGRIFGAVLVFRDVTEQKKAEDVLSRLAAIVESSKDAIVSKDLNGTVTSWNAAAERIYGWKAEEIIGKSKALVMPPDKPGELQMILRKVRAGERIPHYDTERIRKDGSLIHVSVSVSPLLESLGHVVGASTIARDITGRLEAEARQRENESHLAGMFESAMDAIVTVDGEQRVLMFNPAAERMFGISAGEAIGQPLDRFIPERFRSNHHAYIERFGETGVTSRAMGALGALSGLRADGTEFPIEASISQSIAGGRKLYTVILRDVTDRRKAEQELYRRQAEIEALNERLRRSMRETHHRVRNSLQLIAALADMQVDSGSESVPVEEFRRIGGQVRALATVHDILTSEAAEGSDVHHIPARKVLQRLVDAFRQTTPGRGISTQLGDIQVTARQASSIAIIVNELLTNAIKHSPGEITVLLRAGDAGQVKLEVLDEGPGFPPDFDVEVRQSTGLSLIQHIAKWDLNGTVEFGRHEKGGRVTLALPLGRPEQP